MAVGAGIAARSVTRGLDELEPIVPYWVGGQASRSAPFHSLPMSTADELTRALHALAQPAAIQYSLFPDWVVVGDELALAFNEALEKHRASGTQLSIQQASALDELAAYMTEMSGPRDKAFWSNPSALQRDSRWQNIRDMAKAVLDALSDHRPT
jgi:hypothetical protein